MLLKFHFAQLKNLFMNLNAQPKSYPCIGWLKFTEYCRQWKVVDQNLTLTDIDQAFIATNYEEVDSPENDDKQLVRFEFLEILARLAKIKYFDKKVYPTVHESLKALLNDHIYANDLELMSWQDFRVK